MPRHELDSPAQAGQPAPRLWRSRGDRVIAGVLGGLAEKFGWESRPVRLLYGLLTVVTAGVLAVPYLLMWSITRVHGAPPTRPRLWRSRSDVMVAGVLGGLAEKFDVSPWVVRSSFVVLTVLTAGIPIPIYLLLWAVSQPGDTPARRETSG